MVPWSLYPVAAKESLHATPAHEHKEYQQIKPVCSGELTEENFSSYEKQEAEWENSANDWSNVSLACILTPLLRHKPFAHVHAPVLIFLEAGNWHSVRLRINDSTRADNVSKQCNKPPEFRVDQLWTKLHKQRNEECQQSKEHDVLDKDCGKRQLQRHITVQSLVNVIQLDLSFVRVVFLQEPQVCNFVKFLSWVAF